MAYKTLYRVFRPAGFDEVYGQRHITDILKRQVQTGKASHAYLFYGPRGTGKTSTAKIFANALNCLSPKDGEPCGECEVCRSFKNDAFVDIVEIDAASNNGVDNVRDIREKVSLLPAQGKYKVYIIDEVHMLSTGAFNALLKTLEEPPPHAVFILATTELRKVPATIMSRCQKYDFKRITPDDIIARLKYVAGETGIKYEEEALELIAQQAEGAMRDALSIMDQCIAGGGELTHEVVQNAIGIAGSALVDELMNAVMEEDAARALEMTNTMLLDGVSAHNILRDLIVALSNELATNVRDSYECANILRSLEALIAVQGTIRYSNVPNAVLTAAIVRAAVNTTDIDTGDIDLRLKKLERRVENIAEGVRKTSVPETAGRGANWSAANQKQPAGAEMQKTGASVEKKIPEEKADNKKGAESGDGNNRLNELKDEVLHKNMALYPSVNAVKAIEINGNRIAMHVADEDLPIAEMLASEAHRADVDDVLQSVFGQKMTIEFVRKNEDEAEGEQDMDVQQELIALFGEENVDIIE